MSSIQPSWKLQNDDGASIDKILLLIDREQCTLHTHAAIILQPTSTNIWIPIFSLSLFVGLTGINPPGCTSQLFHSTRMHNMQMPITQVTQIAKKLSATELFYLHPHAPEQAHNPSSWKRTAP